MLKINRRLENPVYFGAKIQTIDKAKALRKELTEAEQLLWNRIRRKQIDGYRFRRQHAINQFIADFYCHEKRLVIEVDGEYHNDFQQVEYDLQRTYELEKFGIKVIRFTNDQVENEIDFVLEEIRNYFKKN